MEPDRETRLTTKRPNSRRESRIFTRLTRSLRQGCLQLIRGRGLVAVTSGNRVTAEYRSQEAPAHAVAEESTPSHSEDVRRTSHTDAFIRALSSR